MHSPTKSSHHPKRAQGDREGHQQQESAPNGKGQNWEEMVEFQLFELGSYSGIQEEEEENKALLNTGGLNPFLLV